MTRRAILAALIIAAFVAAVVLATPRSAPEVGFRASDQGRTEAPQPKGPTPMVGSAGASPTAESGGASSSPAALSTGDTAPSEPTPSGASMPGSLQSTPALTGAASWYCLFKVSACTVGYPASGLYAAAGPRLRSALGPGWRGKVVTVTANGRSVVVRLVDTCQCYGSRLIDLYASAFARLAPLSAGLVRVTVREP